MWKIEWLTRLSKALPLSNINPLITGHPPGTDLPTDIVLSRLILGWDSSNARSRLLP